MLERLASFSFRNRRWVLLAWIVALPLTFTVAKAAGGTFDDNQGGNLKGVESQQAIDLLRKAIPDAVNQASGRSGQVVFEAKGEGGVVARKDDIEAFLQKLSTKRVAGAGSKTIVARYQSPFSSTPPQISADGTIAMANLDFSKGINLQLDPSKLIPLASDLRASGMTVEFGGQPFEKFEVPQSEAFGLVAAVVILLIAFGSLIAMGLPILTGLFGVTIAIGLVQLSAAIFTMPSFVTSMTGMIGLGVGIDYVLFIITRYRDELALGKNPHDATVRAIDTSGRAVLFAGITVMISMLGMFLMRLDFVNGIAIAGAMPVLVIVLCSLTLIPAMLGFIGHKINSKRQRAKTIDPNRETIWHRWSRFVQRRAVLCAVFGVGVLLALGQPVFSMRFGFADQGNGKPEMTTRKAYDLKAKGFGPGSNGPFLVVADTSQKGSEASIPKLVQALRSTPGVAFVLPPDVRTAALGAVPITVIPKTGPQEEATTDLVHTLRKHVIAPTLEGTSLKAYVGGWTAAGVDFSDVIGRRMYVFIGAVLALSFLLLMAVFRSILVPLKAVIMNLLSIGASYGVVVAIFQRGHFGSLLDLGKAGPIEPWAPMMLFAIVFGLSMDYEVFLLSKIREEFDRRGDNSVAVVEGLASTARLITAAAGIMVCVFLGFVLGNRQIKLFGIGLATAVFLDATVVRILLVPATMELLGNRNWWFPKWLDNVIPKLNVEGHRPHEELLGSVVAGD